MGQNKNYKSGFFTSEISRRDFLKNSIKGAAVIGIPLILTPSAHNILLANSGNDPEKNPTLMTLSMMFKEVVLSES